MASFDTYAPRLKRWEGGWSDNPDDAGGATMAGVTLKVFRAWYGAHRTKDELRHITDGQWRAIMKAGYWDVCKADLIANQSVAEIFVDWCVNSGTGMIRKVQEMVGTKADGIVGAKTIAAINGADPCVLHGRIHRARVEYYLGIVERKPSQRVFLGGWLNRVNDFKFSR